MSVIALLKASHFPQTVAMVLVAGIAAWLTSVEGLTLLILIAAVLSGQLSVGWVNDFVDAELDRSAKRAEKPVVAGALEPSALRIPIAVAIAMTVPLSVIAAGLVGGLAHVAAVASAHVYNLFLSRTVWSWVPYAVSFGLLPLFVAQASSRDLWPNLAMTVLFALVGVIAHLLNALPDIDIDRAAGKGGLAVSLGRTRSIVLAATLAGAAVPLVASLIP